MNDKITNDTGFQAMSAEKHADAVAAALAVEVAQASASVDAGDDSFLALQRLIRETLAAQAAASFAAGRQTRAGRYLNADQAEAAGEDLAALTDDAGAKAVQLWTVFYSLAGDFGAVQEKLDALTGVLSRISVAAAKVGIELEGAELIQDAQL